MAESDRDYRSPAPARTHTGTSSRPVILGATAAPFVAPAQAGEHNFQAEYSARQETNAAPSPGRYTGRSTQRPGTSPAPSPVSHIKGAARPSALGHKLPNFANGRILRTISVPWSLRLVIAVALLAVLALAWRVPGLFTPPIDSATGVEATNAAFVNVLAGHTASPLDPARLLPPPSPWYGEVPVNPSAGLPIFSWVTAGIMLLTGPGAWVGRFVSMLMSLLAGLFLFATVRRTAGARAALYALLLYSVAPLSVLLGQQFSPGALLLATQSWTLLALIRWRMLADEQGARGSSVAFAVAILSSAFLGLIDPGALFLSVPAVYIVIASPVTATASAKSASPAGPVAAWNAMWRQSLERGKAIGIVATLAGTSILWWAFDQGAAASITLGAGDGGGGIAGAALALLNGGTYIQIVGLSVERMLSVAGLLLLAAGLLHAARPPRHFLFHAWLAGGLLHVLLDASRLPAHDDVLLPLILPGCALAGIGAAWAGALPARIWLAIKEQKRDKEADFAISPHTAWLLDLPEERLVSDRQSRPQAQLALGKSVAQRSQTDQIRVRSAWLLGAGHLAVFAVLALIVAGGMPSVFARLQPAARDVELARIGSEVAGLLPVGARIIVAGPYAPELFYSSRHTGWAIPTDNFSMAEVQLRQSQGASYLLSADQEWLGHQPDYKGLITSYSVLKLSNDFILFDLNTRPADSDRLYFLESGHTLGGAFRTYWESHGGVGKLGYPISEEVTQTNPLDGQVRSVQYFERAVLEYHNEKAGTPDAVMLASVGLWVTQGRNFAHIAPFKSTSDDWYFAETGHSVKQAFLKYWQQQGGVAMFGYPISEELPEINPGDGKVYTVQYFERARFEWHPTFAGTTDEVQLGLIGKQALEMVPR